MHDVEALMQDLDRQSAERTAAIREMLYKEGRADLVADLDAKLREVANGVSGARGAWHALSEPQRSLLRQAARWTLYRRYDKSSYCTMPSGLGPRVAGVPTARNLIRRELLAVDGGAFDPEAKLIITERGKFVLKHGPIA